MYYRDCLAAAKTDVQARKFCILVDIATKLCEEEQNSGETEEKRSKRYIHSHGDKFEWFDRSLLKPSSKTNHDCSSSSPSSVFDWDARWAMFTSDFEKQYARKRPCLDPSSSRELSPWFSSIADNTRSRKKGDAGLKKGALEQRNPDLGFKEDALQKRNPTLGHKVRPDTRNPCRLFAPSPNVFGFKNQKGAPDYSWILRDAPRWLLELMINMDGSDLKLIFERKLFKTDVDPGQSRLSMPVNQLIHNDFLTPVEWGILVADINEDKKTGVRAILVDPEKVKWSVILKRWETRGSWNYCLTRGWNDIVDGNDLEAGDDISVWSFRRRDVLCFALVRPPPCSSSSSS